jgi:hypothetical protein
MTTTSNLALIHRSILRSINDSIPNQIPTARNFPALSLTRPEHHPSCHPSIHPPLLHRHHRKVPQPASHARKDCGERNEKPISQKPKAKERSQRPRRNEPQRCVAAATSAQTINGETRKATKKSFGYRSFVSLAQVSRQKERKEKDLNPGLCSLAATPLQLSWLFRLCRACGMAAKIDYLQPGAELWGVWEFLFWCQLNSCLHLLPGF